MWVWQLSLTYCPRVCLSSCEAKQELYSSKPGLEQLNGTAQIVWEVASIEFFFLQRRLLGGTQSWTDELFLFRAWLVYSASVKQLLIRVMWSCMLLSCSWIGFMQSLYQPVIHTLYNTKSNLQIAQPIYRLFHKAHIHSLCRTIHKVSICTLRLII